MTFSTTDCHPQLLRRSLEDLLSEQQEDWLAGHLEHCPKCRQELADLAGDPDGWSRVESALRDEISGAHLWGRGLISTLIPQNQGAGSAAQPRIVSGVQLTEFAVDFLEPALESDSLGRLNDIEIRAIIGQGGNGIVLKGFQKELNRLVAVKVMVPQLAANAEARKRFAREAQATAAIVHPNVMPVLTVHSRGQLPYLVMPYVDCESLQHRLDREGSLPVLDVLCIAHQVACGLAAAHAQGLVHRDVKPANILLERSVDRVMLTDFGLARAVDDATLTSTGLIAGTPQYMSPEQARGDSVDTQSDLFSLGSVMYAMCTGRPPFRAQTSYGILRRVIDDEQRPIGDLNAEVPAWLEGFINCLLAKQSESRFASAEEVASLLQSSIAHVRQPQTNLLPAAVRELAERRKVARATAIVEGIQRFRWLLAATLMVVAGVMIFASGLFDAEKPVTATPDDQTAVQSSEPLVGETQEQYTPTVSIDWDGGIDRDLQSLDREMDNLLESLESNAQFDNPSNTSPKGQ